MFIFILIVIFVLFFSKNVFGENPLEDFSKKSGELYDVTLEASTGNIDFSFFWNYFKDIFLKELISFKKYFSLMAVIVVVSSLAECFSLDKSVLKVLHVGLNSFLILCASQVVSTLFSKANETVIQINDFLLFSVPYYCSFLCAVGKPVAAAKGSLISLGCGSILSQLITKVFFPFAYFFYVICVSSSLMENDIFKSLKKLIHSLEKILLPSIVGIYTTVLTLFLKTSSHSDTLVFKTAKTAISGAVPFLGNVLNQSADAVLSSMDLIRSQTGIAGVICLLYILSSPILKLLASMLMFRLVSSLACFLGSEKQSEILADMAEVNEIYASVVGTVGVVALITIMLLIK